MRVCMYVCVCFCMFNYPELVTRRFKDNEREVKKAVNLVVHYSSSPRICKGKGRERNVIQKMEIRTEWERERILNV